MFRFLSTLFSGTAPAPGAPDRALVEAAIERLLDGTDPRLRGFLNYRARLRDGVANTVGHVLRLIDSLPAPAEISHSAYASDPRLRAFFASPGQMRDILQQASALQELVGTPSVLASGGIFVLLSMDMQERQVLGMELQGHQVRRDVLQGVVNFSDHRFVCASATAEDTLHQLKVRAFDFLVEQSLKRILRSEEERVELEQQRLLLQRKLDAMHAGNWGLAPMLASGVANHPDYRQLEQNIAEIEARLAERSERPDDIEAHFSTINDVLVEADRWLALRAFELRIDAMLVRRDETGGDAAPPIDLTEVYSASGERRIILLGFIPRNEIPPRKDLLAEAQRMLG